MRGAMHFSSTRLKMNRGPTRGKLQMKLTKGTGVFIIFSVSCDIQIPTDAHMRWGAAMPIYEFYCEDCHMIFNFFSRTINTKKTPNCPKCKIKKLTRQVSMFAVTGKAKTPGEDDDVPFDESKMEQAMSMLAGEAETMDEEDPRQAAGLMRKLSDMSGLKLGSGMEEALSRMEKGEDPENIEAELGDILENEDPFTLSGPKGKQGKKSLVRPAHDETLYDL